MSCRSDSAVTVCEATFGNVRGGYAAPTKAEGLSYCWVSDAAGFTILLFPLRDSIFNRFFASTFDGSD